jgi:hypothetical protein
MVLVVELGDEMVLTMRFLSEKIMSMRYMLGSSSASSRYLSIPIFRVDGVLVDGNYGVSNQQSTAMRQHVRQRRGAAPRTHETGERGASEGRAKGRRARERGCIDEGTIAREGMEAMRLGGKTALRAQRWEAGRASSSA